MSKSAEADRKLTFGEKCSFKAMEQINNGGAPQAS
jgi:hypothetical protein